MKNYKFHYSTGYKDILLDETRVKGILKSGVDDFVAGLSQEELVKKALEQPINSARLRDMAKDKKRVLIITSDHTRPVPSRITLPIILEEVRSLNSDAEIRILIATGFHRASTHEEMVSKFGENIVNNEIIINHDSRNKEDMSFKGILPSGAELWLNSLVDWADLVISEGFIEPHFFAGFSGGRKSILPGIAYERTVMANHCARFIAHKRARTGILEGNPIQKDMVYAAHAANLSFILNVVINGKKEIIKAFAGNPDEAHSEGCKFVKQLAEVKAVKADIVITSNGGYPLDQNIYQSVKGMTAAEACVRQNGVIIMVASCNDGHGGESFFQWFAGAKSASEVAEKISRIPQMETFPDQWEAQILARVLLKCTVIMVTDMCDPGLIEKMHIKHASSMEEALLMAEAITGKESDITVIPDGVGVIVI